GHFGLVAAPIVLDRLGLKPGEPVRLGSAQFELRGALQVEPDRLTGAGALAPRAIISASALPATGLIAPGSMIEYSSRVVLPAGADVAATIAGLREAFPNSGWRVRDAREAAPQVTRFI